MTISIAEVIEEAAQLAEGWDSGAPIAKDIRALAAQYEGCIVADGKPVLFAVPWQSQDQSPLYRAKQLETCKPALQVERADARRPLTDEEIHWIAQHECFLDYDDEGKAVELFARAIERAHKIGGNDE